MRYYKQINGNYISAIGINIGGEEISESEYTEIFSVIRNRPTQDGYGYRLKTDLTWEQYELPEPEADPDLTDSEALAIIMGGAT